MCVCIDIRTYATSFYKCVIVHCQAARLHQHIQHIWVHCEELTANMCDPTGMMESKGVISI